MSVPITLYIPEELYERLRRKARIDLVTVPTEMVRLIQATLPGLDDLPDLPPPTPEELGYPPDFFEKTAGSLADDPIERLPQCDCEMDHKAV